MRGIRGVTTTVMLFGVLVLTTLGAVGCSSTGSQEPLAVSLVNLRVTDTTLFETSLAATLRITNPNPDPLAVSGAYFKLYLDHGKVGDGTYQGPVTVDGLSSTVVEVPFHVSHVSMLRHAFSIMEEEAVDWALKTVVWVEGGMFGRRKVKIVSSGRIDFDDVLDSGPRAGGTTLEEPLPGSGPGNTAD